jgi:hypothetical protein
MITLYYPIVTIQEKIGYKKVKNSYNRLLKYHTKPGIVWIFEDWLEDNKGAAVAPLFFFYPAFK